MSTDYQALFLKYPAVISSEQLYRICHISKRKAAWLLQNGYIPCSDTGKTTRRYKILLEDVIIYLQAVEAGSLTVEFPKGQFTRKKKNIIKRAPVCQSVQVPQDEKRSLLSQRWENIPDALSVREAAEIMGLSQTTISKKIRKQELKSFKTQSGRLITKEWLLDFAAKL